jgi:hypothetical protein
MNALQQLGYDFSDESQLGYDFSDDDNVESESDYEIQTSLEYGRKRRKKRSVSSEGEGTEVLQTGSSTGSPEK